MKTVTTHIHNLDKTAKIVWDDARKGFSVYRVKAGFIASFWLEGVYAEPTFPSLEEARLACYEMEAQVAHKYIYVA